MPHAELLNEKIVVQTHWNEKELVKKIPGSRYDGELRLWVLPVSWAACVQLRGFFGPALTIGPELTRWAADERDTRIDDAIKIRALTDPLTPAGWNEKLYPFQVAGVDFLEQAESALLGDEMGTGKTIQALQSVDDEGPLLVICPNAVKHNWRREVERWTSRLTPYVVEGGAVARKKIIDEASQDPTAIVIANFEALRAHSRLAAYGSQRLRSCVDCDPSSREKPTTCERHPRDLNLIPFRVVIVDEAHRIKDPNAKQTRACWALGEGESVRRRFALTGTPIANDPSDLWSIMHFVYPLEYPRKTAFVDRYCLLSWGTYGGMEVKGLRPDTRDEFYKFFDPRFRRLTKAEVLPQLPPKIRTKREVALSPKQLKAYSDIESSMVTRLPDGSVMVARDDLVSQTRLLQFASASMQSTEDGFRMCDPSSKVDQLIEDLLDLGDAQVAVSAEHRQLINLAAIRLDKHKISYGLITGGQKPWERDVALRDFQAGKLRVMLYTLKAGGTGLTMTAAGTLIRLQRSWSMIDNTQGEDRHHRIGSEIHRSVNIIDYVATGTVEDAQTERLWEKSERLEEINRDRARLKTAGLATNELDVAETEILASHLGQ